MSSLYSRYTVFSDLGFTKLKLTELQQVPANELDFERIQTALIQSGFNRYMKRITTFRKKFFFRKDNVKITATIRKELISTQKVVILTIQYI